MSLAPPPAGRADWALFLDLDGTLAPLCPHPDDVEVPDATRDALRALSGALGGAVAVLSGRPLAQLRRLLPDVDGLVMVGCHGAEADDGVAATIDRPALAAARIAMTPVAGAVEGAWIEDKPAGFAVHYRACPDAGPALRQAAAQAVAGEPSLRTIAGHAVVEVGPAGTSKGHVLERLLQASPFRGRVPVAVGDDVTDEDAFAAAARHGGFGVLVGARDATAARHALPDVAAAAAWLRHVADGERRR